jgi:hypothetical protein
MSMTLEELTMNKSAYRLKYAPLGATKARKLAFAIPPTILVVADEVIEGGFYPKR